MSDCLQVTSCSYSCSCFAVLQSYFKGKWLVRISFLWPPNCWPCSQQKQQPNSLNGYKCVKKRELSVTTVTAAVNRNAFTLLCAYLGQTAPAFVQWWTVHGVVAWLCLCPCVGEVVRNDSMHSDSSGYADEEVSPSRRWQKSQSSMFSCLWSFSCMEH